MFLTGAVAKSKKSICIKMQRMILQGKRGGIYEQ